MIDFTIKNPFRDFKFICQNTIFYVDRGVLYDSSLVFKMFFDDNMNNIADSWTENEFEPQIVNIFLNAVYNHTISYVYSNSPIIYKILDKYDARPDIRSDILDMCVHKYSVSKETIELVQLFRPESIQLLCKRYMTDKTLDIYDSTDIDAGFWKTCLYSIQIQLDPYLYWVKVFRHIRTMEDMLEIQGGFWERYNKMNFKSSPDAGL